MEYFLLLVFFFLATFLVHKNYKLKLFHSKKQFIVFWLIILAFGIIWDTFAIARTHWTYNSDYLIKITIGNMPLEDYFFIIVVTYVILVLYQLSIKCQMRNIKKSI